MFERYSPRFEVQNVERWVRSNQMTKKIIASAERVALGEGRALKKMFERYSPRVEVQNVERWVRSNQMTKKIIANAERVALGEGQA
jgi:DNA replication protein DnaD